MTKVKSTELDIRPDLIVSVEMDLENTIKVHSHLGTYLAKAIPIVKEKLIEQGIPEDTTPKPSEVDKETREFLHTIACLNQAHTAMQETIEQVIKDQA